MRLWAAADNSQIPSKAALRRAAAGRLRLTLHPPAVRGRTARRTRSMHAEHLPRRRIVMKTQGSWRSGSWTLAAAAAVALLALGGCNQQKSANETAKDVADARQDAAKNVAEERKEAADTAADSAKDQASAEYDVAVAQADGQRKIAKEKCESLQSDAQKACKDQADATYESAKAQAQATLDAAKRSGSAQPAQ
jgi:hypothetical protein